MITVFLYTMLSLHEFIKLTKSEPAYRQAGSKVTKRKFNWTIDEGKYLTFSQVKKLRQHCKQIALSSYKSFHTRDWFLIELGLFCGLRVSEMRNLKVGDLNIQDEQSSLIVKNGKGGKTRVVYFSDEFKESCILFLEWKKSNNQPVEKENFVLTNNLGNQLTKRALQKAFKRCLKGSGLDIRYGIHSLRHTFATHLYKASSYNLRLVQQQLGHSSIRTTQVYANLFSEDMKKAVGRLYQ